MIPIEAVFDAYININILLVLVFGFWCLTRKLLKPLGMAHAYTTQLRLLNGMFLVIALSPVFVLIFNYLSKSSIIAPPFSLNLSDMIVAQYLQGNIDVKPARLEEYLGLRSSLTHDLLGLSSGLGLLIVSLFVSGIVLFTMRFIRSVYLLRKIIRSSHVWRRFGNLQLLVSNTVSIPFTTRSLNNRYIVVPSSMLTNPENLKIALGHEFQHIRQFDLEWEIGLELLRPLFFWNPVYYLWKQLVEQLRELSCDQRVLARSGFDPKTYCECLLQVCENSLEKNRLFRVTRPNVALVKMDNWLQGRSSAYLLRRRINSLLDENVVKLPKSVFPMVMILFVAIVAVSTLVLQKPDDWSQDRIMLSTIVNLERLTVRNVALSQ